MSRTIYIGKLFGIEFRLHYSWFIVFFLLTFLLVEPNYQKLSSWLIGIGTSLLFFTSVLAHELAHSLTGKASGVPVTSIVLHIFGGMAMMENEVHKPEAEFKIAIAGPLCSLLLGGIFGLLLILPSLPGPVAGMFVWLAVMNGILAVFNLIPGFPLDGGRVLRSIIWKATGSYRIATRLAAFIGQGFGLLLILAGILIIIVKPFGMNWGDGLWLAAIGWFLSSAASASYRSIMKHPQTPPSPANRIITDVEYRVIPTEKGEQKD